MIIRNNCASEFVEIYWKIYMNLNVPKFVYEFNLWKIYSHIPKDLRTKGG